MQFELKNTKTPDGEALSEAQIHQSKYLLNAAIMSVLRDKNPVDVHVVKQVMFELLESSSPDLEPVKYDLIDGRILDAADHLFFLGQKNLEDRGDYFVKAGLL